MTTWNYRIVQSVIADEVLLEFFEVYYDKEKIISWTENSVKPCGASPRELRSDLRHMQEALKLPFLTVVGDKLVEI